MKKIDIAKSNNKKNNESDYRKFVAKNIKLTPYDKALIDYIYKTVKKEVM